jgi:hypothetical protein
MKKILQSLLNNQSNYNVRSERGHSFLYFFEGCLVDDEECKFPATAIAVDRGLRLALTFAPSNKQS